MLQIFYSWQTFVFLSIICNVIFFQFYRRAVRNAHDDNAATILLQVIGGISVLAFVPFFPITFPSDYRIWSLLLLTTVFYAVNDRFQTTGRRHIEVSVFTVIEQLKTLFIILLGISVFKEAVDMERIFGAILIVCGNIVLFYKNKSIEWNKYAFYVVGAAVAFALAVSIDIGISSEFNLPIYISLTLLIPAIMIYALSRLTIQDIIKEHRSGSKMDFWITGLTWGVLIIFMLQAYRLGEVTIVTPLLASTVLINVVVAYMFQNEKKGIARKFVAACLVVLGVILTVGIMK